MTVQALGFPEEWWDVDGDYFCRPHPDYVAAVIANESGTSMWVDITTYRPDPPSASSHNTLFRCWFHHRELVSTEADCPLQAQAIIQNFINNLEGNNDRHRETR